MASSSLLAKVNRRCSAVALEAAFLSFVVLAAGHSFDVGFESIFHELLSEVEFSFFLAVFAVLHSSTVLLLLDLFEHEGVPVFQVLAEVERVQF